VSAVTEINSLLQVSARIGAEPLLVQAATGNTSIKLDGALWIKASGKWMAQATREEILIPVSLAEARRRVEINADPAGQQVEVNGKILGASVETAMHAVIPSRVVLHVHSVNTIAWAVRQDGRAELASRLDGISWQWIPYVPSGLPLARAIQTALTRAPLTDVLVLANHGLVVCGENCEAAETLLREVEDRVAIAPREVAEPQWPALARLANGCWRVPDDAVLHSIGTDGISRRIVSGGVLYPCQAIFLTTRARAFPHSAESAGLIGIDDPFVMIEDAGMLVRQTPCPTESATLAGLADVLRRIPASAPIHYLRDDEVRDLLCADSYHYRAVVEDNGRGTALRA
jgi:rhamnose utilization protein RhaD (predicted bifunctional aldolase and dehydrogenase)